MGLWAGGLGDWARGGRWGEVALPTIGEAGWTTGGRRGGAVLPTVGGSGLGCRAGSSWAMVSTTFGGSGVLVRGVRRGGDPVGGYRTLGRGGLGSWPVVFEDPEVSEASPDDTATLTGNECDLIS